MSPKRMSAAVIIFCITIFGTAVLGVQRLALASCNPGRANDGVTYFAGWISPQEPQNVTANSADIYNYVPYMAPGSGGGAWVMVNGSTSGDFAQVGWWIDSGGRYVITEWDNHGALGWQFYAADPAGSTRWYEVYKSGSTNWCFADAGTTLRCSGSLAWGTPRYGEDLGEIHSLADQMPGSLNTPEDWNNSFIFYNGTQHNFNGFRQYNPTYFNDAIYSQIHAQAGDQACAW
jgi:hypothetical protein